MAGEEEQQIDSVDSRSGDAPFPFWERIQQHKIIQWGVAYLAGALALAHGQELVGHAFHWPEIVGRLVMIVLIAGLPIALTLAWYHGHRRLTGIGQGELAIVASLLLLGAVFFTAAIRPAEEHDSAVGAAQGGAAAAAPAAVQAPVAPTSHDAKGKLRIAILPFENLSSDPGNAFFTDGMHEEILSTLASRAHELSVISRTTMMQYRSAPRPVAEIAAELGATHVLEGSVRREGDRVRLTVQLIDAASDRHLWSQDYDRTLVSAIALQTEVAAAVATQLSTELLGSAQDRPPTTNPEAYDFYLKGQLAKGNLSGLSTEAEWREVEMSFTRAIELDPSFALAYLARARHRSSMFTLDYDNSSANLARVREDVEQARGLLGAADPLALMAESDAAFLDQDYARALELVEAAEAAGLADGDLGGKFLLLIQRDQNLDAALPLLEQAATVDRRGSGAFTVWYAWLLLAHRPVDALRVVDLARSYQPNSGVWDSLRNDVFRQYTPDDAEELARRQAQAVLMAKRLGGIDRGTASELLRSKGDSPDAFRLVSSAGTFPFAIGLCPLAELYGWDAVVEGDRQSAAQNAAKIREFVARQEENKWNRWFLHMLTAEAQLFAGNPRAAAAAAREALTHVSRETSINNAGFAKYKAAQVLAWTGDADEAAAMLESIAGPFGPAPLYIARDAVFTKPLADNPRFQTLVERLEAEIEQTRRELDDYVASTDSPRAAER